MGKILTSLLLIFVVLLTGCTSASATPAAKIVGGVATKVVSAVFKWLWSLKATRNTAISTRSMMRFESGYTVDTVFDGSKLGIEPYSVEVSPAGELLILDSENNNIYKVSTPLSIYSRPKLLAGSPEGHTGHVDGRPREARMNHPKGITVDGRGNIYVADTMNMVIRKISDDGVVTIAGGKWGKGGGHVDGPGEDAKFSDDFDVVYIGSSCSLLVIDRGNQAIREIQLHDDDCSYQQDDNLHLGLSLLASAGFFGYMLALLQRRVCALFSSHSDIRSPTQGTPPPPYQRPPRSAMHPPIPAEDENEKGEEGLFSSLRKLFLHTGSSVLEIFGGMFSGSKRKLLHPHIQQQYHHPYKRASTWPVQDSFVIPDEDEPPSIESRDPTPRKAYPYMTKDLEKTRHVKQNQSIYGSQNSEFRQPYDHQVKQLQHYHHQHHQKHYSSYQNRQKQYSSSPQTFYDQKSEAKEIVFGAVQEQDGQREAMVIKAVDYGDPIYSTQKVRSRYNYMGYSYGY